MGGVPAQGEVSGRDGFHGAHGVALDAGDLDEAADGVAGQAQVVFHGDLGGHECLAGRTAQHLRQAGGGHGGADADLGLATADGGGDGGPLLEEDADLPGRAQEGPGVEGGDGGAEVAVVEEDGGDDAGGAVGGARHDAAHARVLFVDGQGEAAHPLVDRVEILGGVEDVVLPLVPRPEFLTGQQFGADSAGAALDVKASG